MQTLDFFFEQIVEVHVPQVAGQFFASLVDVPVPQNVERRRWGVKAGSLCAHF